MLLELVKVCGKVVGVIMIIEFMYVMLVVIYLYICYCDV